MYAISADIHAAIAELCREYRVEELSLFGSVPTLKPLITQILEQIP
jgi:hypothetical protein